MSGVKYYSSVAIRVRGRYLTMFHTQKNEHPWRFPGGKIESTENTESAAIRELKEELNIVPVGLQFIGHYQTDVDKGEWIGSFFLCTEWNGKPTIMEPEKHDGWQWFTPSGLLLMGADPEAKAAIDAERGIIYGELKS